jgi:hypothetical protein
MRLEAELGRPDAMRRTYRLLARRLADLDDDQIAPTRAVHDHAETAASVGDQVIAPPNPRQLRLTDTDLLATPPTMPAAATGGASRALRSGMPALAARQGTGQDHRGGVARRRQPVVHDPTWAASRWVASSVATGRPLSATMLALLWLAAGGRPLLSTRDLAVTKGSGTVERRCG